MIAGLGSIIVQFVFIVSKGNPIMSACPFQRGGPFVL